MFENVGQKIQTAAKIFCWLDIIAYIIIGFYLITLGDEPFVIAGIVTMIVGPLLSWAGSLLVYGFGQLVEKFCDRCANTRKEQSDELPEL